jgi:hypothetical protein
MDGLVPLLRSTAMTPISQYGWSYTILARDHQAANTPKWTDQSEHHYLHTTPYAKMDGPVPFLHADHHATDTPKMDGLLPFLHATTMPLIRQHGRTVQNIITSMNTHTPKLID